jgi:hypothetical protein
MFIYGQARTRSVLTLAHGSTVLIEMPLLEASLVPKTFGTPFLLLYPFDPIYGILKQMYARHRINGALRRGGGVSAFRYRQMEPRH